jgi:hypothetical protein
LIYNKKNDKMTESVDDHFEFERSYWGNCTNTFDEERKQLVYADHMFIPKQTPYVLSAGGKRVLDIGGGPISMLLKCVDLQKGTVVDPIKYPQWTQDRYAAAGIDVYCLRGEDISDWAADSYDEVWIYNCLQHVDDPGLIIKNAAKIAPTLRLFEWVDIPAHEGHPHELTSAFLRDLIRQAGGSNTGFMAEQKMFTDPHGCYGAAYAGYFSFPRE